MLYSEDFIIDSITGKQIITWSNEKILVEYITHLEQSTGIN